MIHTLFLLLGWHAIADFPLQGDFLSRAKNQHTSIGKDWWRIALPMHGLIHGIGVAVITGSTLLGIVEVLLHSMIDYAKCENWISINDDQTSHIICKIVYMVILARFPHFGIGL